MPSLALKTILRRISEKIGKTERGLISHFLKISQILKVFALKIGFQTLYIYTHFVPCTS